MNDITMTPEDKHHAKQNRERIAKSKPDVHQLVTELDDESKIKLQKIAAESKRSESKMADTETTNETKVEATTPAPKAKKEKVETRKEGETGISADGRPYKIVRHKEYSFTTKTGKVVTVPSHLELVYTSVGKPKDEKPAAPAVPEAEQTESK